MKSWIDEVRDRRDAQWWAKWEREHRWDALAQYNAECSRGIVHTPEWDARMAEEQERFNVEMDMDGSLFPVQLDPS